MARKVLPVIMCGGAGTRVWPESRETMPKQFIPLIGTARPSSRRSSASTRRCSTTPVVITNRDYRFLVREQLEEIGAKAHDRHRAGAPRFRRRRWRSPPSSARARDPADRRRGVRRRPCRARPEGLPRRLRRRRRSRRGDGRRSSRSASRRPSRRSATATSGPAIRSASATRAAVDAFVEKPDLDIAKRYVAEGYLWNSGNFFFRADAMLDELRAFEPEMVEAPRRRSRRRATTSASSRSTRRRSSARRRSRSTTR